MERSCAAVNSHGKAFGWGVIFCSLSRQSPAGLGFAVVEGPGFGGGQTGIYVKDITDGGPAQKVPNLFCVETLC